MIANLQWMSWLFVVSLLWGGCTPSPTPIRYGQDNCANCQMLVMDNRFGAELVTDKGKVYVFDSIECLAWYREVPAEAVHSRWVTDYNLPGTLIDAAAAFYLSSDNLRSPMGVNLSAFSDEKIAASYQQDHGGEVLRWDGVTALVARAWQK